MTWTADLHDPPPLHDYQRASSPNATPRHDSVEVQHRSLNGHSKAHQPVGLVLQRHSDGAARPSFSSSKSLSSDLELDDMQPSYLADDEEIGLTTAMKTEESEEQGRHSVAYERRPSVDSDDVWDEARRLGKRAFVRKVITNGTLIAVWYLFSICISVYNKWMFSPGNLDFHFPLFTTSVHMLVQFSFASIILFFFPRFRPRQAAAAKIAKDAANKSNPHQEPLDPSKPIMTPWFYLTRIATCGTVTGLDIGLGNTSLKYISLTFFTMCKSSTLGFVLAFAILFRLEKPSWKIGGIIFIMTVGVVMMVAGETAFNGLGFALLMMASFCSGFRWSLTQILLRRTPATSNPFVSLFFLTPVMFVILFVIAIPAEGFSALGAGIDALVEQRGLAMGICIILFPGCLAFCMVSTEFALLQRTSVVTLSVCGVFKEVLTITAAGLIFGDVLTPINVSGLVVTLIAIAAYNVIRIRRMKKDEVKKAAETMEEHAPAAIADLPSDGAAENLLSSDSDISRVTSQKFGIADGVPTTSTRLEYGRQDFQSTRRHRLSE